MDHEGTGELFLSAISSALGVPFEPAEQLSEFEAFMREHPHHEWLKRVFQEAKIDYGRVDYGMVAGAPVVWEINLNPDYGNRSRKNPEKRNPEVVRYRRESLFFRACGYGRQAH